jgi:hypothetical protein
VKAIQCLFDIEEAAFDVTALAHDCTVEWALIGNVWSIYVQHAEILNSRQRRIEQGSGPRNPHPDHADNHAGSPRSPIAR